MATTNDSRKYYDRLLGKHPEWKLALQFFLTQAHPHCENSWLTVWAIMYSVEQVEAGLAAGMKGRVPEVEWDDDSAEDIDLHISRVDLEELNRAQEEAHHEVASETGAAYEAGQVPKRSQDATHKRDGGASTSNGDAHHDGRGVRNATDVEDHPSASAPPPDSAKNAKSPSSSAAGKRPLVLGQASKVSAGPGRSTSGNNVPAGLAAEGWVRPTAPVPAKKSATASQGGSLARREREDLGLGASAAGPRPTDQPARTGGVPCGHPAGTQATDSCATDGPRPGEQPARSGVVPQGLGKRPARSQATQSNPEPKKKKMKTLPLSDEGGPSSSRPHPPTGPKGKGKAAGPSRHAQGAGQGTAQGGSSSAARKKRPAQADPGQPIGMRGLDPSSKGKEKEEQPYLVMKDLARGQENVRITVVNEYPERFSLDDEKWGLPKHFMYMAYNVLGKKGGDGHLDLSVERRVGLGCRRCKVNCVSKEHLCSCVVRGRMAYNEDGKLLAILEPKLWEEQVKRDFFIPECSMFCSCDAKLCSNRVVQRGIKVQLQLFMTRNGKGWGVRPLEDVPKGTFLFEYVGEILTNAQQQNRNQEYKEQGLSKTFPIMLNGDGRIETGEDFISGKAMSEGLNDDQLYNLDATQRGNVARFVNHSCDANTDVFNVQIETHDTNYYHPSYFATKDIGRNVELTFDYGPTCFDAEVDQPTFVCLCGNANCRNPPT